MAPIIAEDQEIAPQLAVKRGPNSIVLLVPNNEAQDTTSSHGWYTGSTALLIAVRNGCRWIIRKMMLSRASDVARRDDEDTTSDIARKKAWAK